MWKRLISCGFVLGLALFMLAPQIVKALDAEVSVATTYDVDESGVATVQHIVSAQNRDDQPTPKKITLSTVGRDIEAIEAQAQDDGVITPALSEDGSIITLEFADDFTGTDRQWSFSVSYRADVMESYGLVDVIQLSPLVLTELSASKQAVAVTIDVALGFAVVRGPEPSGSRVGIGSQILTYENDAGLVEQGLTYYFGEQATTQLSLSTVLKNESWWWQTKTIVLPPDTNQQQVYLESIEPRPTNLKLDPDGNMLAEYRLSPKREITVEAQAKVALSNLTYSIKDEEPLSSIDPILIERYTSATDHWQPNELELNTNTDGTAAIVQEVFDQVVDQIATQDKPVISSSVRNETTVGFADQLVGALRGKGIPARVVIGKVMTDGRMLLESPTQQAWVEAYVPGSGWVTLDPVQELNSAGFGTSDVLHVAFTLWGIQDSLPPINTDDWTVLYIDDEKLEPKVQIPGLRATKSVLFPGISLLSIEADMPAGYVVDGAAVTSNIDSLYPLGSLAPLQTATTRQLRLGASSFSTEAIAYGLLNGEGVLSGEVSTATSSLNVIPMLSWIVLLILGGLGWLYFRHRRTMKEAHRSRDSFVLHQENIGSNVEEQDLLADATTAASEPVAHEPQIEAQAPVVSAEQVEPPVVEPPVEAPTQTEAPVQPTQPIQSHPESVQPVAATQPTSARLRFRHSQPERPARVAETPSQPAKNDNNPPLIQG